MNAPQWLTDLGRAYYTKLRPLLRNPDNIEVLAVLSDQLALYETASKTIQIDGLMIDTKTTTKSHPLISVQSNAANLIAKLSRQLFDAAPETANELEGVSDLL